MNTNLLISLLDSKENVISLCKETQFYSTYIALKI